MSAATTPQDATSGAIPVIDLAPFIAGARASSVVVRAVEDAGRDLGFLLVTGHGVSKEVTDRLYSTARTYFDEPQDWKATEGRGTDVLGGMSYSPIAEEALAATKGIKTPGDIKESLNFGRNLKGDTWAARPAGLEQAFQDYYAEMETLSGHMRRIFCSAIGLAPDYFEKDFVNHLSALRVINYPEQTVAPEPVQLRAGVHTDYGLMAILRSEASPGGLQVQNRNGDWLDAPSIEGAFVINIADTFMRWTNDEWVSTPHRVENPPSGYAGPARRQSIPFFLNPSKDTLIECLPAYVGSGAKYAPITFEDYIPQDQSGIQQTIGPAPASKAWPSNRACLSLSPRHTDRKKQSSKENSDDDEQTANSGSHGRHVGGGAAASRCRAGIRADPDRSDTRRRLGTVLERSRGPQLYQSQRRCGDT